MSADPPRIRLLTTGGTIASVPDGATGAMRAATPGAALVDAIPDLRLLARLEVEEVALVNSWDITLPLMAELARRVEAAAGDGVAGVVITHGTDTMEETAFALDLLTSVEIPVVLTGAMRGGDGPDSDGPRNLHAAVQLAASTTARGLGCVVVMGDEIHAARWVHKSHTSLPSTFISPAAGPLGTIDEEVRVRWRPARAVTLRDGSGAMPEPADDVALVWFAAGMPPPDPEMLSRTAGGVVVAGGGAGNVPAHWLPPIRALLDGGMPVVLASRCEAGRVVPIYGGDGGGRTLADAGVIPAGDLSAVKARIALSFALGAGLDRRSIRELFARFA